MGRPLLCGFLDEMRKCKVKAACLFHNESHFPRSGIWSCYALCPCALRTICSEGENMDSVMMSPETVR